MPVSVLSVAFLDAFSFYFTPSDTLLRAIGKQAHTLHSLAFFSFSCVLGSTAGYASGLDSQRNPLDIHFSMVIFKISPVIPTHVVWLAMLLLIGILGLISQVCSSLLRRSYHSNLKLRRRF